MVVCRSEGNVKINVCHSSCLWLFSGGDQKLGKAIRCSHDPQRQNRRRADRGELQGVRIFLSSYSLYRHFYNFIEAIVISFVFVYIWIDTEPYNINIGYWQNHKS